MPLQTHLLLRGVGGSVFALTPYQIGSMTRGVMHHNVSDNLRAIGIAHVALKGIRKEGGDKYSRQVQVEEAGAVHPSLHTDDLVGPTAVRTTPRRSG